MTILANMSPAQAAEFNAAINLSGGDSVARGITQAFSTPVAGRQFKPAAFMNMNDTTFQRVMKLYTRSRQVVFVFDNMAQAGSPNESAAGAFTLAAGVVWGNLAGGVGVSTPLTFNGATSVTLQPYASVRSDPVTVPWFVAAGDAFAVRSYTTMTGAFLPVETGTSPFIGTSPANEGYQTGDFASAANVANSFGGSNSAYSFGPRMVLGNASKRVLSLYLAGDSIPSGTGWVFQKPGTFEGFGYVGYFGTQNNVAIYNGGRGGETIATAVTRSRTGGSIQRQANAPLYSAALCTYGTNDIGVSTFATIKANLLSYWAGLRVSGPPVFQTTILPRTTSTDQWQTPAAQTVMTGEADRLALNQWIRAPASAGAGNSAMADAAGALAGVIDLTLTTEVNSDGSGITINAATGAISNGAGGRWKTDATVYDSGTSTSWTGSKLNDTSKNWIVNQWWGYTLLITADATTPASVGQAQDIPVNAATQITPNTFATQPSTGATYKIYKRPTTDGIHPGTLTHITMAQALTDVLPSLSTAV